MPFTWTDRKDGQVLASWLNKAIPFFSFHLSRQTPQTMIRSLQFVLATAMAACTLPSMGQVANCGAASTDGGMLSTSQPSICADGTLWAPPTLTGYIAGLSRTEYVFSDPSDIVFNADSTTNGPRILEINTTGAFDPQAAGLLDGDQFEVTAVHYNILNLQSFVEELLNGVFLFTPCCDLAALIGGVDVCSFYNSVGIFNGTDVVDLNVYLASVVSLGGAPSVSNILFSIDAINAQAGQPCTGDLPLCYASSSTITVDVVCATTCSSATPPTNVGSSLAATKIDLSWDAIPGSVACQLGAERLVPPGPSPSQNIFAPEPSTSAVPFSLLGNSTTWRYRVRCACSVSPIDATGFSAWDTFAIPAARQGELVDLPAMSISPNPATDFVRVETSFGLTALQITDGLGRVVRSVTPNGWDGQQMIPVADLPAGIYILVAQYGDRSQATRFAVR